MKPCEPSRSACRYVDVRLVYSTAAQPSDLVVHNNLSFPTSGPCELGRQPPVGYPGKPMTTPSWRNPCERPTTFTQVIADLPCGIYRYPSGITELSRALTAAMLPRPALYTVLHALCQPLKK